MGSTSGLGHSNSLHTVPSSSVSEYALENAELVSALHRLSETNPDYWTFRHSSARAGNHGLSQYPAMMVPKMLEGLLNAVRANQPDVQSVFDPYVGSGTTLVESLRSGLHFSGQDINPLAVLICQVKAGPFSIQHLKNGRDALLERIRHDRRTRAEVEFDGITKWFTPQVVVGLSRIRRSIMEEEHRWTRRVFWLALAETVRLSSNSRTSTFKLHIRSTEDLSQRDFSALEVFRRVLENVIDRLTVETVHLKSLGLIGQAGAFRPKVEIRLGDTARLASKEGDKHDLLITSPPYGDNTSTVPYGQYSFLPLQWIDLRDISKNLNQESVATAYSIDAASLGGSRVNALDRADGLRKISPALDQILIDLEAFPRDRSARVAAFCVDLDRSLGPILAAMRNGAHMIWITGNRRVGGLSVPLDRILVELLEARGAMFLHQIRRRIPSKRMATRNSVSATMREESIQILRMR